MKCTAWLRAFMLVMACIGLLLPSPVIAAATAPATTADNSRPAQAKAATPKTLDIELYKGGMLLGQVVNAQGKPQANMPVVLMQGKKTLVNAKTNRGGFFAVSRVPSGTYQIASGKTQGIYRVWATGTAPPKTQSGALLVVGKGPIRAQTGPIAYWLSNPWIIAGIVAAAVAIPVAIHNHQIDHDTPASP